jgi:SAM-dependent methyltransferase
VKSYEDWFAHTWRFVPPALPPAPASVLEIGCGRFGGFVPRLLAAGYDAVGVDPNAPDGPHYTQCEFEKYQAGPQVDAVIACTSLHHAADLDLALDLIARTGAGTVVVIECAHERFDERTAQWCFARLGDDSEPGWLHAHRDEYTESGLPWEASRTWTSWPATSRPRSTTASSIPWACTTWRGEDKSVAARRGAMLY